MDKQDLKIPLKEIYEQCAKSADGYVHLHDVVTGYSATIRPPEGYFGVGAQSASKVNDGETPAQ